jgi:DNA repair protein RadC
MGTINDKVSYKILFLNDDRKVIGVLDISELENTSQIIIAHNSVSNELKPTRLCYQVTRAIKQAGELLGLKLLDHIILNSSKNYYSFADEMRL